MLDVLTTHRPYRRPVSAQAARAELARHAGSQFDPEVVRALLNVSLGRLRAAMGPVSWLAQLPFLSGVPRLEGAVAAAGRSAMTAAGTATGVGALAVMGVMGPSSTHGNASPPGASRSHAGPSTVSPGAVNPGSANANSAGLGPGSQGDAGKPKPAIEAAAALATSKSGHGGGSSPGAGTPKQSETPPGARDGEYSNPHLAVHVDLGDQLGADATLDGEAKVSLRVGGQSASIRTGSSQPSG